MKTKFAVTGGLAIAGLLLPFLAKAADPTLDQIQSQLQGHTVIIQGGTFGGSSPLSGKMVDWVNEVRSGETDFRQADFSNRYADGGIRGKRGTVVAVEQETSVRNTAKVGDQDVFGKPIDGSQIHNPYFRVIVRIEDDGSLVGTTGYYSTVVGRKVQLADAAETRNTKIQATLAKLLGSTVYKIGYSELLSPTLTKAELADFHARRLAKDLLVDNLTPMKIADAKLIDDLNAVVVKVQLPDGDARLMYGDLSNYRPTANSSLGPLDDLGIAVIDKIPSTLSKREVAAIRKGSIYRGMSETGLFLSWGFPEKTNDYGSGGEQLIYGDSTFVYLRHDVVTDWQSMNQ